MCNQTYVATLSQYNRCFGESPSWEETFEAGSLEEAQVIAQGLSRKSNPDTYVREVKLKNS